MPPEHEGEPLTAEQVRLLRDWIAAGAPAPADETTRSIDSRDHWAFRPIARPSVPRVQRAGRANNPIDAFVAQRHERLGLTPNPSGNPNGVAAATVPRLDRTAADGHSSSRRSATTTSLDGTGGPSIACFRDSRHGERWARHWMDIWRYSDWWGLGDQLRNSQKPYLALARLDRRVAQLRHAVRRNGATDACRG